MPDYKEIVRQSQENVKSLGEKLGSLEKLHQDIIQLKESSEGIPKTFNSKFNEIIHVSEKYISTLGSSAKIYLSGTNAILTQKIAELEVQRAALGKEVSRLEAIDFSDEFDEMQTAFLSEAKKDIGIELKRFQTQADDFKLKIAQLDTQVIRLEDIDLLVHFNKLQNTLSEIFGAINTINLTLTATTQALTKISQSLSNLEILIGKNFKEVKSDVSSVEKAISDKLFDLRQISVQNHESIKAENRVLSDNLKNILAQNAKLDKDIKVNRLIQYGGFALIVIALGCLFAFSGA